MTKGVKSVLFRESTDINTNPINPMKNEINIRRQNFNFIRKCENMITEASREAAKAHFLRHKNVMDSKSIDAFDWCFGRESRLKGWMTRKIGDNFGRKIDLMEAERDGVLELLPR